MPVTTDDVAAALARRRLGYGRGARMSVRAGRGRDPRRRPARPHDGRPGRDPDRQHRVAEVGAGDGGRPGRPGRRSRALARNAPLTRPRPGHADLVGMQKYGFDEARPVLERASARETAARVALGAVAAAFLEQAVGARLVSHVVAHRHGRGPGRRRCPTPDDVGRTRRRPGALLRPRRPARRWSPRSTRPSKDGDTLGGVVEVVVVRPAAGPRQPRPLGPPARLPAGRRADGHPGDQGRRGRRRVRPGPRRAGSAGARRDRARAGRRRPPYVPGAPAAPRAACRPARCCASGPR